MLMITQTIEIIISGIISFILTKNVFEFLNEKYSWNFFNDQSNDILSLFQLRDLIAYVVLLICFTVVSLILTVIIDNVIGLIDYIQYEKKSKSNNKK